MKITIQTYSNIYQKQVENLVLGVQNNEFLLGLTVQDQPDLPNIGKFYENGRFWIALNEQDEVVGTIGIEPLNETQAALRKMFLEKSMRGNKDINLAQNLFETLLRFAQQKGYQELWLDTPPPAQAAHRFYERNGFELMPRDSVPKTYKVPTIKDLKIYRLKMNNTLDYTTEEFQEILEKTSSIILEQYANLPKQKGFNVSSQEEVESWFDEPLPYSGKDSFELLQEAKTKVFDSATGNLGLNMYAYVMSGGNQMSTVADFLASTINQNNTKWHLAPAMAEIEIRVIKWAAEMIHFTPNAGGAMVSGGSEANLAGLTVARNIFFKQLNIKENGLFGIKPFTVYCSKETHNCTDKSITLLGIGTNQLRKIATNADLTINTKALEEQILADIDKGFTPFCIVGNAGTVNTGAIDDLATLAQIAEKYKTWFHVDGAYGGLAASLPSLKAKYAGLEKADSIALDFHKWLYQPFEIGCVLVRDWSKMRETYFKEADYLTTALQASNTRLEFNEHYFQLSRNAKAFKVWMSVKAYGFDRIQKMIQKDIDLTHYLAKLIIESSDFELKSSSDLAVACFRYTGNNLAENEIVAINQKLIPALEADGRVFITGTKLNDEFVLRACIINHRKQEADIEYLLETIRDVALKI